MKRIYLTSIVFIFTLSVGALASAETVWRIAPERSTVNFTVKHLLYQSVTGSFSDLHGAVTLKGESLSHARMKAKIEVKSIDTGILERDKHLMSKDFFAVDQYPEIVFESKSVERNNQGNYTVIGNLTMHGVTHTIILTGFCQGKAILASGKIRRYLILSGKLNRSDYKLTWNSFLETGKTLIGEQVQLNLKIGLIQV